MNQSVSAQKKNRGRFTFQGTDSDSFRDGSRQGSQAPGFCRTSVDAIDNSAVRQSKAQQRRTERRGNDKEHVGS